MGFVIALVVVLLDQGTKFLVQANMHEGMSVPLLKGFFYLTYIKNPGAAFGMLAHQTWFFVVICLFVVAVITFYYRKVPKEWVLLRIGLAIQAGGALGNMIDRVRFGKVVDFLDFRVWQYIFNLADSAIVVGSVILAWYLIRMDKQEAKISNDQQSEGSG